VAKHKCSPQQLQRTLQDLKTLDETAREIREGLGIHAPGAELWLGSLNDQTIVVEANGYGGAKLTVFDDDSCYFHDQCAVREESFDTEQAALDAADKLAGDDE